MAPEIKVSYFDMRGRAEPVRLALTIGKVPFEDDRFAREDWMKLKPTTPYQAAPIMTVDGKTVAQSNAMLRYAGKITGLYPSDPLQAAYVDEIVDAVSDLFMCAFRYRGDDKERVKEEREKMVKGDVPRYWGGLEKRLKVMGAGKFALGDEISVADICIFTMFVSVKCGILDHIPTDVLDSCPQLFSIYQSFSAIPEVVSWYKKHPIPNMTIG